VVAVSFFLVLTNLIGKMIPFFKRKKSMPFIKNEIE
jgi:hypothetical protein